MKNNNTLSAMVATKKNISPFFSFVGLFIFAAIGQIAAQVRGTVFWDYSSNDRQESEYIYDG